MTKNRVFSKYTREAVSLLGKQVRLYRKDLKWTEQELAERAGIARATLRKIEKGNFNVAIGLVFEVAALVGMKLFDDQRSSLSGHIQHTDDRLAVLPGAVRKRKRLKVDDAF